MRKKDKKRVFENGKIHTISAIRNNLICSGRLMIPKDIPNIDDERINEILTELSTRNNEQIFEIKLNQIARFGRRDGIYEIVEGFDYLTLIDKIFNNIGIYYKNGNYKNGKFTINSNDNKCPYIDFENPKFFYQQRYYRNNGLSNLIGRLMNKHFLIYIKLDKQINYKSLDNLKRF